MAWPDGERARLRTAARGSGVAGPEDVEESGQVELERLTPAFALRVTAGKRRQI